MKFEHMTAGASPAIAAEEVTVRGRAVFIAAQEATVRARVAFIATHPKAPRFVHRLAQSGALDFLMASSRQALRGIGAPVDLLEDEARAAWVLRRHAKALDGLPLNVQSDVALVALTAIRVGAKAPAAHPFPWVLVAIVAAFATGAVL